MARGKSKPDINKYLPFLVIIAVVGVIAFAYFAPTGLFAGSYDINQDGRLDRADCEGPGYDWQFNAEGKQCCFKYEDQPPYAGKELFCEGDSVGGTSSFSYPSTPTYEEACNRVDGVVVYDGNQICCFDRDVLDKFNIKQKPGGFADEMCRDINAFGPSGAREESREGSRGTSVTSIAEPVPARPEGIEVIIEGTVFSCTPR